MKILLLVLIFSMGAFAEAFKIGGEIMEFQTKEGLLVKGCEKDCLALKAVGKFKKIDLKKARRKVGFPGSVGSDVCKFVYEANSILGVNEQKDQRAFCVFKDESLVEINSLSNFLKEKKIVIE